MSNEGINKLSLKTKNLIDDLYNSINYYYIFAIIYLIQGQYKKIASPNKSKINILSRIE